LAILGRAAKGIEVGEVGHDSVGEVMGGERSWL
jgi:hypothetical protein